MKRLQASKYELKTNCEQQRDMRRFAGSCRFVFNKALAMQKALYERGEKKLGYAGLCKSLAEWKVQAETIWLNETPSQALQQTLKDLERAYTNFFAGRSEFPQFKKKGQSNSFRYPQGFKLDQGNSRIFLPKLGWLRYRNSQHMLGTPKNITVSSNSGKWFVSIQTEREVDSPIPVATSAIGIDVGIARFATLSDGSFVLPRSSFKKHEARLAKHQRVMARKVKFSNNWKKAKTRVQKIHTRITHVRRDFLHQTTSTISKNHALVVLEDLQVKNMSKSAKGNAETPGKNVKPKSGLNKSILDQGWFEFRRQLDYKLGWNGGMMLAVPAHNTSRECPECHHVAKENRVTQARFACVECGYESNADHVGAINILARGMKKLENEGQDMADASARCASTARIACEVNGASRPSAAGTHRSDSTQALCPG